MRLTDEPVGSSSLNRAPLVDPFFDVGRILIDDQVVQSATGITHASSTVPTTHYSLSLDEPTICSSLQTRHAYDDDDDKLRQHHHSFSSQYKQHTSTTMTSSWSGSGRTSSQQQQRRRRSANESQGGSTTLTGKSHKSTTDTADESRLTTVSSGTSLGGNPVKTNAGEIITTSHRQQTLTDVAGIGSIESHRINPEWTNLVTAINLRPPIVDEEMPSATRFAGLLKFNARLKV